LKKEFPFCTRFLFKFGQQANSINNKHIFIMRKFYLVVLLTCIVALGNNVFAESPSGSAKKGKTSIDFGVDLMSRYIWRGSEFGGNTPSIQPYLTLSNGEFQLGAWGAFSTGGQNISQELDLFVSQSFLKNMFTVTLTDYFFPVEWGNYNYFKYKKNATGHIFEGNLTFNGTKGFPITVMVATNFYGGDAVRIQNNPQSSNFNQKAGIQYSTYLELGYAFRVKDVSLNSFMGFNCTSPRKADSSTGYAGEQGFYGNSFGVVNLGITVKKSIPITNRYSLPISTSLITNPQSGKVYFVVGVSF
jgi:hypothetical protein